MPTVAALAEVAADLSTRACHTAFGGALAGVAGPVQCLDGLAMVAEAMLAGGVTRPRVALGSAGVQAVPGGRTVSHRREVDHRVLLVDSCRCSVHRLPGFVRLNKEPSDKPPYQIIEMQKRLHAPSVFLDGGRNGYPVAG